MFPRRERLSRASFPQVLARGKRVVSKHFSAVIAPQNTGVAVVVSKKVARLSVTRHRIKRRVLAVVKALNPKKGIIIFPKAETRDMEYDEMKLEISTLLT